MDSNLLKGIYNKQFGSLDTKTLNVFHLKSMRNFIEHFDELNYSSQNNVYTKVLEYLNLVESKLFQVINSEESLSLFGEYIQPLGKIYEKELNFGTKTTWVSVLNFLIICIIVWVTNITIVYILTLFALLWYYIPLYKKSKNRKVYGFKY